MSLLRIYQPHSGGTTEFDDSESAPCLLSFEVWSDLLRQSRSAQRELEESDLRTAEQRQLRSLFETPTDLVHRMRCIRQNSACPECSSVRVTLVDDSRCLEFLCGCCDYQWTT